MKTERLSISNSKGLELAAYIDFPNFGKPKQFAVFAHCFTCNSQFHAVRNISRALNEEGIAVVRFDFTGLGKSEGEFEKSHFEANVEDLQDILSYVADHYTPATLLIGHSLGGAAAIVAAANADSVKAVCTIGAPSDIGHATQHFSEEIEQLSSSEKTAVTLGGREFLITPEFVQGFEKHNLLNVVTQLKKPLLILHSPIDTTVGIHHAQALYEKAHHPKSFVSLDMADHLLTAKSDGLYAGNVMSSWVARYIDLSNDDTLDTEQHQLVGHLNFDDNFTTSIQTQNHGLIADEPKKVGGDDLGMAPYELVSSGLAACTLMTIKMYAARKEWPINEVFVYINHTKETIDGQRIDRFEKVLDIHGELDGKQRQRLKEIAAKCPVHKTLVQGATIETLLKEETL